MPRTVYTLCPSGTACITQLTDGPNALATRNPAITGPMLKASGNAIPVSSITRTPTVATVTLASAPNPALAAGQQVSITGSTNGFNGTYTLASVSSSTKFTVAVSQIPTRPAAGTFLASIPFTPLTLSSLTRSSPSSTPAVATPGSAPHRPLLRHP